VLLLLEPCPVPPSFGQIAMIPQNPTSADGLDNPDFVFQVPAQGVVRDAICHLPLFTGSTVDSLILLRTPPSEGIPAEALSILDSLLIRFP
jgi:hypothetical protein